MKKSFILVFLIIVLIPVLYAAFRPNEILSKDFVKSEITTPHSRFIQWKGNNIHYTDEGSGPTILMIHGLGGSFYNFQGLADQLKNEYRVIRVDIPGMGLSDFNSCSSQTDFFAEYTDFFKSFIEQVHIDSMYLMGNSLGGMMSWMITTRFPDKVRGMVLINSAGYEMEQILANAAGPLRWKWFGQILERGMPRLLTDYCLWHPFADKNKVNPAEYGLTYNLLNREGNIRTLTSLATCGQRPDTTLIQSIKVPTLIIWGQEDVIIPVAHAEKFHRDIPGSKVKIYSPCGHMAMMEFPEEVAGEFKKFFNP